MSREDTVVQAAINYAHATEHGSSNQEERAKQNLRDAVAALLQHDARREKPRWRTATLPLGWEP